MKKAPIVTKKVTLCWLVGLLVVELLGAQLSIVAAEEPAKPEKLNPYTGNAEAIQEGRALYLQTGCSACHGAGGGGGMGPALLDDEWKFGSDDLTLLKLIKGRSHSKPCQQRLGVCSRTTRSGRSLPSSVLCIRAIRTKSTGSQSLFAPLVVFRGFLQCGG